MRLLSINEDYYNSLPAKCKLKRAKLFVKLATILEMGVIYNPDKIRYFIEDHILDDDFEFMNTEDLLLMRCQGFLDNSKILELFPEEFDYLDGIPVLIWDEL